MSKEIQMTNARNSTFGFRRAFAIRHSLFTACACPRVELDRLRRPRRAWLGLTKLGLIRWTDAELNAWIGPPYCKAGTPGESSMSLLSSTCMKRYLAVIPVFLLSQFALTAFGPAHCRAAETGHTFAIGDTRLPSGRQAVSNPLRRGPCRAGPREYWRHRLKMCKAMGLNAVCAYLFWNMHEPRPGEFDWSGQADAAEFCRIAQREGPVGHPPARPLCLRRMGDGRPALVAAEERTTSRSAAATRGFWSRQRRG